MSKVILSGSRIITFTIVYLLSGLVPMSTLGHVVRHLTFLVVVSSYLVFHYVEHKESLQVAKRVPYYYLYFGNLFLLIQNTALLGIHGYVMVGNPSFSFDFTVLNQFSEIYASVFLVDIVGYTILLLYFLNLNVVESKEIYKTLGIYATGIWLVLTVLWRVAIFNIASFFDISKLLERSWYLVLFLVANAFLAIIWFAIYRLYQTNSRASSPLLENKQLFHNYISSYARISVLLLVFSIIGITYYLIAGLGQGFPFWIFYVIFAKAVFVSIALFATHLKIFQQYNLLF